MARSPLGRAVYGERTGRPLFVVAVVDASTRRLERRRGNRYAAAARVPG
ncbi:hypothetical protein BURPS1655_B0031 [Burkholderia pseudomallei 1655]|nr:hypothetical protein BURPS1655_B0031 [Burkholderia pseudomallei 1655]